MSHLTLAWHLRAIAHGVGELSDDPDADVELAANLASHEHDAYDRSMAFEALRASDPVAFLDAVSKDPTRSWQSREDAAVLLGEHVLERRLLTRTKDASYTRPIGDPLRGAFVASDLPRPSGSPGFWSRLECPNCLEAEVLYDWDADEPRCHCGTPIPVPNYP